MNRGLLPGAQGTSDATKFVRSDGTLAAPQLALPFDTPRSFAGIGSGVASNTNLAGRLYLARAYGGGAISAIRVRVTTQSGNIALGIYGNDGVGARARPVGAPKATTGAVACPAIGVVDIALINPYVVVPGDWFGFVADNSTAAFTYYGGAGANIPLWDGLCGFYNLGGSVPLPTIPTGSTWQSEDKLFLMVGIRDVTIP